MNELDDFFFPKEGASSFQKNYIPREIDWPDMTRGQIKCFADQCRAFAPPSEHYIEQLMPQNTEKWMNKYDPSLYSTSDIYALRKIQDTLKERYNNMRLFLIAADIFQE